MKLNFVLSYTKKGKKYAITRQCYEGENLFHKFKNWEQDYTSFYGNLDIILKVSSKKNADAIARAWNKTYQQNGELQLS